MYRVVARAAVHGVISRAIRLSHVDLVVAPFTEDGIGAVDAHYKVG